MAVPGSWNDVFTTTQEREFFGDVWYQRRVKVPNGWTEQVLLYFESVTHTATVFVDGVEVAEHKGGYLPFEVDITQKVSPGGWFTLTVIINNQLSFETIPPGLVHQTSSGPKLRTTGTTSSTTPGSTGMSGLLHALPSMWPTSPSSQVSTVMRG